MITNYKYADDKPVLIGDQIKLSHNKFMFEGVVERGNTANVIVRFGDGGYMFIDKWYDITRISGADLPTCIYCGNTFYGEQCKGCGARA